jgi:DNA-binding MarR family transcriptional regulator
MLSKSEIEVVSEIVKRSDQRLPQGKIAKQLGWSDSYASRVVSELKDRGYVQTNREDGKKFVTARDIPPIEHLRNLINEFGHVDFPGLISGAALKMLYYLDSARTATELAELSKLSRNTVYRRLDSLQKVGVVGKRQSQYTLNEPFKPLFELSRSIAHQDHLQEVASLSDGGTIIWEMHDEYLFSCESDLVKEGFHLTGPAAFEDFGIPLLTRGRRHYFRSREIKSLSPCDLVCHMLLIEHGSRYRTYCLLLIEKQSIDKSELAGRAEHYEEEANIKLVALTKDLCKYLKTNGEIAKEGFPEWQAFKNTARDYNIAL